MSIQVAFFRNVNLGQSRSRSPRSSELVDAFAAAGATSAVNFQTNGTVIFTGDEPAALAESVVTRLTAVTGYADLVVVRSAGWLIDTVGHIDPDLPAGEVALFNAPWLPDLVLPHLERAPTGELVVHTLTRSHAVTSATGTGISAGPVLTRLIGVPVTCRGIPTMRRLVTRLTTLTLAHPVEREMRRVLCLQLATHSAASAHICRSRPMGSKLQTPRRQRCHPAASAGPCPSPRRGPNEP